jgi:hypothetical protein
MCKCVVGILLADFITISLLYASFIELNLHDDHYNLVKLFDDNYDFDGKNKAKVIMSSYMMALIIHSLTVIIKCIYHLICCCGLCCGCCDRYHEEVIYYG